MSKKVSKKAAAVKVGNVYQDNDPRGGLRWVKVLRKTTKEGEPAVVCHSEDTGREVTIRERRLSNPRRYTKVTKA